MAIIRIRNGIIHIQWYDHSKRKTTSKSLGIEDTNANLRRAKQIARQLQDEMSRNNQKKRMIGIADISIKAAFDHFLKVNEDRRPKTIEDYKRFFTYFKKTFNEEFSATIIAKLSLENWLSEIKKLSLKPNTIYGMAKQAIHFCNFLFEYNYTAMFKVNRSIMPKPESVKKIVFEEDDMKLIFKKMVDKNANFKILVNLLAYTGLRSTDLLGINMDGIDLTKQTISYYSLKSKQYRDVPFHPALINVLTEAKKNIPEGKLLAYNNETNLGRAIVRYFGEIKIDKKGYSARTFRKTFITWARNRYGVDATVLRELVGHSHRNIMDKHYNDITIENMRTELEKIQEVEVK